MDVDEDMVDARTPSSIVESSALSCSEHELEIPDFAKSWGRVRRPSRLPEDYDLRIDRAAIFILDGPSTHYERSVRNSKGASQQLVVAKRCDSCKISHAACSRRTGAESPCKKCRGSGHRCKTTDPGFDPLPKLPVKRKRIPSVAGASLETPSSESTTSRTSLRPRVKQESPAVVPIAPTTKRKRADIVHEPSEPSSSASAKAPNVRRKASMPRATTDMVSSSQGKAKKPRTSKINVPPVAVRAAAVKTPATRRTEQVCHLAFS
ncbi:hypothetical protein PLICRDRAFT_452330 [Plicaturopsis crispa FD-325 SS-3]|uniref:Unplaced genomic scaffold PLICRscaffold_25, whole genome shotgun sequence n=1 Tax=Plicaturopsis crispa FD-325 SS-3 TaxID=944288 RepID=A0A0C9SW04_PLICR|nr:hypothetical protein PLICRDRAFT_452330 [Plicaturopsis crispa FD-325 SS-3]